MSILLNRDHSEPLKGGEIPTPQNKTGRANSNSTQAKKVSRRTPVHQKVIGNYTPKPSETEQSLSDDHTSSVVTQALNANHVSGTPTRHTRHSALEQMVQRSPDDVSPHITRTVEKVRDVQHAASERQLSYYLAATAMMNVADEASCSLNIRALAGKSARRGFRPGEHYDVGEALAAHGKEVDIFAVNQKTGLYELVPRSKIDPSSRTQAWFVQAADGQRLPGTLLSHVFKLGATYVRKMVEQANGLKAGVSGHYAVTQNPAEACFGVYLHPSMATYPSVSPPTNVVAPELNSPQ